MNYTCQRCMFVATSKRLYNKHVNYNDCITNRTALICKFCNHWVLLKSVDEHYENCTLKPPLNELELVHKTILDNTIELFEYYKTQPDNDFIQELFQMSQKIKKLSEDLILSYIHNKQIPNRSVKITKYSCHRCAYNTTSKRSYDNHMNLNTCSCTRAAWHCPLCNDRFLLKSTSVEHYGNCPRKLPLDALGSIHKIILDTTIELFEYYKTQPNSNFTLELFQMSQKINKIGEDLIDPYIINYMLNIE